ncbi:MAG: bifunctional 5,10-methylenetetrahydrofolate dehydrogenase/5,10-methenyltetrahydrofolate cyclohydrolase [Microgenomates group bacterium]
MKFDGKAFALEIEDKVKNKVRNFVLKPEIVSVLVGDDPASALYTKLKKAAAERVGITFEIYHYTNEPLDHLRDKVIEIGSRVEVTGVMVQLPLPGVSRKDMDLILQTIPLDKDVDGLRYPESGVVPPVVKAILDVIVEIEKTQSSELRLQKYVIIGASGFVGSATCRELEKMGKEVIKIDSDTQDAKDLMLQGDIIISCVGKEGVVTEDMVREGAVVIDVGAPRGDMTKEVYQKASVSVEVPGGIGPVTIASLLQNAVDIYGRRKG